MTPLVATTGTEATAAAGAQALRVGGTAVDAVAAAVLAWPAGLTSAGALLASGTGLGRVCCLFPAHTPGLGLSRPRRIRLFGEGAPAATVATPAAAPALAAVVSRWGRVGFSQVARAALGTGPEHAEALEVLAEAGPMAAVKGTWALEAVRSLGPMAGGLLTRRDLIEARASLLAATSSGGGRWVAADRDVLEAPPARADDGDPAAELAVVAVDRSGCLAAVALERGKDVEGLPTVAGVQPNSLLAGQPATVARKVGRPLPLSCACALIAQPDDRSLGLAGPLGALRRALESADASEVQGLEHLSSQGLLVVAPGPRPRISGAASQCAP